MKIENNNIEIRNLTKEEFNILMEEAPSSETMFIRQRTNPYEFFNSGEITEGLIINKRPIYIAMVRRGNLDRWIFWTIVNSNLKDKITLCKSARRELKKWIERFKSIYATMEKNNIENMKFVKWLGFNIIEENERYITYKLGE